jgi:hypothetical protein
MISALDLWAKNEFGEGWKGVLSVERGGGRGVGRGRGSTRFTGTVQSPN